MVIDEAGMIAQDLQNMRIEGEVDRKNREAEVLGRLIRILGAAILSNRRGPEGRPLSFPRQVMRF